MDVSFQGDVTELATRIAAEAKTVDDINAIFRDLKKATLERMLDVETGIHLGRVKDSDIPTESTTSPKD